MFSTKTSRIRAAGSVSTFHMLVYNEETEIDTEYTVLVDIQDYVVDSNQ